MSEEAKSTEMKRVLVFGGKTGWIGNLMCELMEGEGAWMLGQTVDEKNKKLSLSKREKKSFDIFAKKLYDMLHTIIYFSTAINFDT